MTHKKGFQMTNKRLSEIKSMMIDKNGFPKGLLTLWQSPEAEPLVGCGAKPCIKPLSVSHRVNLETVSTVSKEGHALQVKAAPF